MPESDRVLPPYGDPGQHASADPTADRRGATHPGEPLGSDLMAVASHEMRGPICTIGAVVELLQTYEMAADMRAQLDVIAFETQRLARLVDGLLQVGRLGHGRWRPNLRPVQLGALCAACAERAAAASPERPWRIEVPDGLPAVTADPDLLEHVLANLLDNAQKYSPTGSPIEVSAGVADGGGTVFCRVTNGGQGIVEGELERIFDQFHRAGEPSQGHVDGHGLGLYIARSLVEAHGGSIEVESSPGRGATFTVRLPVDKAAADASG